MRVVAPRQFDHRWRDVDADSVVDVVRQRLGEAGRRRTRSRVLDDAPAGDAESGGLVHESGDIFATRREEFRRVPFVSAQSRVGEDRPQRINASEGDPVALEFWKIHRQSPAAIIVIAFGRNAPPYGTAIRFALGTRR